MVFFTKLDFWNQTMLHRTRATFELEKKKLNKRNIYDEP